MIYEIFREVRSMGKRYRRCLSEGVKSINARKKGVMNKRLPSMYVLYGK